MFDLGLGMLASAGISAAASLFGGQSANKANAKQAAAANAASAAAQEDAQAFNKEEAIENRLFNHNEAAIARQFNMEEAAKAREFASAQTASQYQRAMEDMRKAGLNPLLAYQQGGNQAANVGAASAGAASGSAASSGSFTGQQAHMENVLGPAVASGLAAAQTVQGLEATQAQIRNTDAQTAKTVMDLHTSKAAATNYAANTAHTLVQAKNAGLQPQLFDSLMAQQRASAADLSASARSRTLDADITERYGRGHVADTASAIGRTGTSVGRELGNAVTPPVQGAVEYLRTPWGFRRDPRSPLDIIRQTIPGAARALPR